MVQIAQVKAVSPLLRWSTKSQSSRGSTSERARPPCLLAFLNGLLPGAVMEEDLAPKPLRIVKRVPAPAPARRRQPSGMSGIRYPPIPRRQSSLRVNYRQISSESGTSTETPPLREGFERLSIPKKRRSEVDDLEKGLRSEAHTNNPIDCNEVSYISTPMHLTG